MLLSYCLSSPVQSSPVQSSSVSHPVSLSRPISRWPADRATPIRESGGEDSHLKRTESFFPFCRNLRTMRGSMKMTYLRAVALILLSIAYRESQAVGVLGISQRGCCCAILVAPCPVRFPQLAANAAPSPLPTSKPYAAPPFRFLSGSECARAKQPRNRRGKRRRCPEIVLILRVDLLCDY